MLQRGAVHRVPQHDGAPTHRWSATAHSRTPSSRSCRALPRVPPLPPPRTRWTCSARASPPRATTGVYDSLARAVRDIARDEGARGFFRGLAPAIGQIVPYMGGFFAVYESLRLPLGRMELPFSGGAMRSPA